MRTVIRPVPLLPKGSTVTYTCHLGCHSLTLPPDASDDDCVLALYALHLAHEPGHVQ